MLLEPSFYGNDVVRAELNDMEEIENVQGPERMSLEPKCR